MYQNDAMKILTGEVRLSYCNLTTPRAAKQGGEPKYSVTLLIPKSDAATKADIDLRHRESWMTLSSSFRRFLSDVTRAILLISIKSKASRAIIFLSVSYTHLDVYKRQVYRRSLRICCTNSQSLFSMMGS